ncbi:MAG TPA: glutamine--fructose-6-phosphate transaminase (isomerizing), partial [Chroococcales cyanobacterium]
YQGDILQAVFSAIEQLEGAYALGVLHKNEPDRLVGVKQGNPLIAGIGEGEQFIASDIPAILNHTRDIIYLEDGEVLLLEKNKIQVFKDRRPIEKEVHRIDWNLVAAEKAGFEHFMLKEIYEQPTTLTNTLGGRIDEKEGKIFLDEIGLSDEEWRRFKKITIVACGTAFYAGLVGKYLIEDLARLPVEVDYASEFRYRNPVVDSDTLLIAISQSGETIDTLAALREANRLGATSIGIINTKGSAISREVKGNLYIHAGPEIGVASTKAYTSMVAALTMLALHLGQLHGRLDSDFIRNAVLDLKRLPALIGHVLEDTTQIQAIASKFQNRRDFLFLGRGVNFPTAMEGALKLKEISYIHAEAYAAGEMKHGPIALIDENLPILAIATASLTYEKVVSNLQEVKARGGTVIALATQGDEGIRKHADHVIYLPPSSELVSAIVNVIPCQLLAYYIAKMRGCDVDQPRNLAKSVTVE